METLIKKRIGKALLLFFSVFAIGTIGFYSLLDNLTLIDALYLTIITLTTVGYGDFSPHNNMPADGNPYFIKLFAIVIILVGMGSVLYVLSVITEYIVSGELTRQRNEKRMEKMISSLKNHYLLCGGGYSGFYIMQELRSTLRPFVLIEKSEERLKELVSDFKDLMYIQGDATNDYVIEQAGLKYSTGIIAALPDEKDNLFIVMSIAHKKGELSDRFRIAAKVENLEKMGPKMKSAGADYIISPQRISSRRMVSEMFRPSVTTFLDRMLNDENNVIRVEEVTIRPGSEIVGKTLKEARIPEKTGLLIAAIRKEGAESFITNPGADQVFDPYDVLIIMGAIDDIIKLREITEVN